jgi:hypothetical protein
MQIGATHDHLQGDEEATGVISNVPVENALIENLNSRMLCGQLVPLQLGQFGADFDDIISYSLVNVGRILVANVIEHVASECAVPGADLINDQIVIRIALEHIFGEYTLSDGLTVPWLKGEKVDRERFTRGSAVGQDEAMKEGRP